MPIFYLFRILSNICLLIGPTIAFQPGITGDQFDKLAASLYKPGQSKENKMTQPTQGGNMLLDILNNHGDTLQQVALLAYLSKGEDAKPFLQATTAAKVIFYSNTESNICPKKFPKGSYPLPN